MDLFIWGSCSKDISLNTMQVELNRSGFRSKVDSGRTTNIISPCSPHIATAYHSLKPTLIVQNVQPPIQSL